MRVQRRGILGLAGVGALLLSGTAWADGAAAVSAPASGSGSVSGSGTASGSGSVSASASGTASGDGQPASEPAAAQASPQEEGVRIRWGISGYGGPLEGGLHGGAGGLEARIGAQINETFGVYGQPMFMLGAGASSSASGVSASGIGLYGAGVLADATLSDLVFLAAGPEILLGGFGSASANVNSSGGSTSASGAAGAFFSVVARAGLALGSMQPHKRRAFTIGLDLRVITNPGDPVVVPCLALGYDQF